MTFAEVDVQYELLKQRYLAGELADEQYDDALRELMLLDDQGRWWAKSRENGAWHYYDAPADSWLPGLPPMAAPDALSSPPAYPSSPAQTAATVAADKTTNPASSKGNPTPVNSARASSPAVAGGAASGAGRGALPKWAAVAPASVTPPATGGAGKVDQPAAAPGAPAGAAAGYHARDFGPIPELSGSLKVVFFVLSLLVPVLGFVLFLVYRKKPAQADRSAARVFLILGVISLVFACLGSVAIYVLESVLLGIRAQL